MQELLEIHQLRKARSLLHPIRVLALRYLAEPRTCRELADILNLTQQRLHHHLLQLRKAGLIRVVKTRRKGNVLEAVYQRTSKAYWLSSRLMEPAKGGATQTPSELNLHQLLVQAETLQNDVAALLTGAEQSDVPSMSFDAEVALRDEHERDAFTQDMLRAFHDVAEKYQAGSSKSPLYKVLFCCYPQNSGGIDG